MKGFITLETAKLAKEKGFNIPVYYHYSENPVNDLEVFCEPDDPQVGNGWNLVNYNSDGHWVYKKYSAPTQSELQTWLREIHNIDCHAMGVRFTGYTEVGYYTYAVRSVQPVGKQKYKFDSWEEALEVGLKIGLKLINN